MTRIITEYHPQEGDPSHDWSAHFADIPNTLHTLGDTEESAVIRLIRQSVLDLGDEAEGEAVMDMALETWKRQKGDDA